MGLGIGIGLGIGAGGPSFMPGATVALDFTTSRYRVGAGGAWTSDFASLPGLTVSRSSVGYAETSSGLLVPFSSNVARITNKGLLVEEARTNLFRYSQDATQWPVTLGITITADAATAPDGTSTADQLTLTSSGYIYGATPAGQPAGTYAVSCWVRASAPTTAMFRAARAGDGTVEAKTTVAVTTTWQRVSVSLTTNAADQIQAGWDQRTITGGPNVAATIFVWGAQIEAGSFATSYIPTTSATATRAADSISVGGLSVAAPFTIVSQGSSASVSGLFPTLVSIDDGSINNRAVAFLSPGASNTFSGLTASAGGVSQANFASANSVANGTVMRHAAAVETDNFRQSLQGGSVASDVSGTAPSGLTTVRLGVLIFNTSPLNGYLRKVVLYPRVLSDAELQAATA